MPTPLPFKESTRFTVLLLWCQIVLCTWKSIGYVATPHLPKALLAHNQGKIYIYRREITHQVMHSRRGDLKSVQALEVGNRFRRKHRVGNDTVARFAAVKRKHPLKASHLAYIGSGLRAKGEGLTLVERCYSGSRRRYSWRCRSSRHYPRDKCSGYPESRSHGQSSQWIGNLNRKKNKWYFPNLPPFSLAFKAKKHAIIDAIIYDSWA